MATAEDGDALKGRVAAGGGDDGSPGGTRGKGWSEEADNG